MHVCTTVPPESSKELKERREREKREEKEQRRERRRDGRQKGEERRERKQQIKRSAKRESKQREKNLQKVCNEEAKKTLGDHHLVVLGRFFSFWELLQEFGRVFSEESWAVAGA